MSDKCPVCNLDLKQKPISVSKRDATAFSCEICGNFTLTRQLIVNLHNILQEQKNADVKISHALRSMQRVNKNVELSSSIVDSILEKPLPRPKEQADLLIRWFAEHSDYPGDEVFITPYAPILSSIGAETEAGFYLVLSHLIEKLGLVRGSFTRTQFGGYMPTSGFTLTFEGWDYYETLLKGSATYRKAFMAMKFGDPDLNAVLENVFKPNTKLAGFDLFKLDDVPNAGLIDDRLRVEIQSSDFLIADLTHDNLGAYWEAGYAEGLGKPVIYTCEQEKFNSHKTHFDTNHHLTVLWDKNSPQQAGEQLKATIRATLPHLAKLDD